MNPTWSGTYFLCYSTSTSAFASHLPLLLAAPTWLWGRCGKHNSPPASSVMDFILRRSDGSHVSVDTVHPSLLRSSSFSSPGWYHLQSLSSDVVLVSPLYMSKPHQSCFPAPLCDVLYLQSLSGVIVSHMNLHLIYPYFFPVVTYSFTNLTLEIYLEFVPDKI